jgi:3-oxoacyl-[acyl-carrier protein] reductase
MEKQQTILLTGGPGSSIGARLLEKLSDEAYQVAATWLSRPQTACADHEHVHLYNLDVTQPAAVDALVERVERELGAVDILINNAGIFAGRALPMTSYDDWQMVLEVNLTGVFNMCKVVSRRMMQRKKGKIINLVSLKGIIGGAGESAYSASKAGVIALTKSLARELAPYNIAVHAVCPGFISSELNSFDVQLKAKEAELALMDITYNLEDVVNFISFLCGDSLKSVTGQVFHIDSRIH